MEEITLENLELRFHSICRFCLSDADCLPVFLPDGNINDRLQKAFEIIASKVDESDGLPNNVCSVCLQRIEDFVDFEANCTKSYEILMKCIQETTDIVYCEMPSMDCGSVDHIKSEYGDQIVMQEFDSEYIYNDGEEIPALAADDDPVVRQAELVRDDQCTPEMEFVQKDENSSLHADDGIVKKLDNDTDNTENDEPHPNVTDALAQAMTSDVYNKACNIPVICYSYRNNRKVPIVQCMFCDKTYRGRNTLRRHLRIHFNIKNYSCAVCKRTFHDKTSLRIHVSRHSDTKPFQCDHCDRSYYSKTELKQHCVAKHGIRKHICEVCNKRFPSRTTLQDHAQVHASERTYVCSTCGKSFKRNRNLVRHFQNHTKCKNTTVQSEPVNGSKMKLPNFHCTVADCFKKYKFEVHLTRHMRLVHGE
ncbi:zinc finger protein 287-like [Anopheles funestus]|uniref:zinc finger protein 287-like n=1 Tax=Anopheles funestus TaxID=62324 RepID=UPI0020C6D345|nr:zinc finger protein 287-like [Anopheles funestus]XP_049296109.1 zinc finger protein 287-like [Anopheles funestus]